MGTWHGNTSEAENEKRIPVSPGPLNGMASQHHIITNLGSHLPLFTIELISEIIVKTVVKHYGTTASQ